MKILIIDWYYIGLQFKYFVWIVKGRGNDNPRHVQCFKVICKEQLIKIWMISEINTIIMFQMSWSELIPGFEWVASESNMCFCDLF